MNEGLVKCLLFILLFNIVICKKRNKLDELWEKYKKDFGKHYKSAEEEAERRKILEKKHREIEKHNEEYSRGIHKFTMGHNHLSDMRDEEIRAMMCPMRDDEKESEYVEKVDCESYCQKHLPADYLDWRKSGVVTPVKNQLHCGSCYAFCAVGAIEAHNALKTDYLTSLSEQEIIDCSRKYGNRGCKGGSKQNSLKYIIENKGIDAEKEYPYSGRYRKKCSRKNHKLARVRSFKKLKSKDEENLRIAVGYYGPVITSIHVTPKFYHHKQGVFHSDKCKPGVHNHCVLIMGYGIEDGTPYWLIKNSWGYNFGEGGYIKMIRNANSQCSVATYPVLPIMY